MVDYYGNSVYLTRIIRTDSKKNSSLSSNCKYIGLIYDNGSYATFYPVNSKIAMEKLRETFKKERELSIKKQSVLNQIFENDPMGILN